MSHPRGVEMFSSGEVYSLRVLGRPSRPSNEASYRSAGISRRRDSWRASLDPRSSILSVPQLSWPVVAILFTFFNASKLLGQTSSSVYNTSLLSSDSLIHGLLDRIVPSHDVSDNAGFCPRPDIPMPVFSSAARCWSSPWSGSATPQIVKTTNLRSR